MIDEARFLPPPVARSDEEPIAPGGWQVRLEGVRTLNELNGLNRLNGLK
jgi:hypothetical protein